MNNYGPMRHKPPIDGILKPKSLKEVPAYVMKKIKGFLTRLFYVIGLVYKAAPFMLFAMAFLCVLDGFLPVIGAFISSELLNGIARLIIEYGAASIVESNVFTVFKPIIFVLILQFIYLFLKKVLNHFNIMVTGISGELVVNYIKTMLITKAKEIDLSSFDRPEFYEKLENANREASMRPISILASTFNVISAVISVVSFVVVLVGLSPYAPLVILVASIPGAFVNYVYRNRSFRYLRRHSKERRLMNYYSGIMVDKDRAKEVKILGLSDTFIDRYKTVFGKYYKGLKSLTLKEGITQILVGFLSTAISCALFFYVAYTVVYEGGQIGDYSLYSGALTSIAGYVTTLLTASATIYEGTLFIDNMIEFMKEEPRVVAPADNPRLPERNAPHTIEFKNVSFRYPGTERDVIKNLSLKINEGESVVLVGLNGAGKTTLIKLLTRLYDTTEGEILLDGHNLKEYDPKALYDMFGIVFQDFGRYAESVGDNLRFGDIDAEHTDDKLHLAAKQADASSFIDLLPSGYDTPLTRMFEDNGIELSGGQWQKLSVGRAFYKEADILILDEPTASLDPLAEQEIFNRFAELSRDKITVFVSHRLSSATYADKIVVLDGGAAKEIGTHEELMEKKGIYHHLFTTQAKRYSADFDE